MSVTPTPNELEVARQRVQEYIERHDSYLQFLRGIKVGVGSVYNLSDLDKKIKALKESRSEKQAKYRELYATFVEYDAKMPTDEEFEIAKQQQESIEAQRDEYASEIAQEIDKLKKRDLLLKVKQVLDERMAGTNLEIEQEQATLKLFASGTSVKQEQDVPEPAGNPKWKQMEERVAQCAKEYRSNA